MEYGYGRVSTQAQNEDRQSLALIEAGVPTGRIFIDKCSGKDFERDNYRKLVRQLRTGDTLLIKSIDRLGRNYTEILEQWRYLTKDRQVDIAVLDMPLLDTRKDRDLTGTLIADIVLQLLSYVAETERSYIRQRQKEGICIAKEKGVRFGRPKKDRPEAFQDLKELYRNNHVTAREAARQLGISHSTFLQWVAM